MRRRILLPLLALAAVPAAALSATKIVNIIPASLKTDKAQNAEPNIAVNPVDPTQVMISVFGSSFSRNPIFITRDGGATWKLLQYIATRDTSMGFDDAGIAYMAHLGLSRTTPISIFHDLDAGSSRKRFAPIAKGFYNPGGGGPDQPWCFAAAVGGVSHIYVGFNDLSQGAKTASIRLSLDSGKTWRNVVLEHVTPANGQDGYAVRGAANGNTVYAVFERWGADDGAGNLFGDLIVMRDDAAGAHDFTDNGADGADVDSSSIFPEGAIGQERIGSDVSIAVDPTNDQRVYVAYGTLSGGGLPQITVVYSIDGGATWTSAYTTPENTALPALAIAGNGTVGLLYTLYDGVNLETHFSQSSDDFVTSLNDQVLSIFEDASLIPDFDPYIGDYEEVQAVGNTFYGTFSASNDTHLFPQQPTFLRDTSLLGTKRVPFSIDPYFFSVPAM